MNKMCDSHKIGILKYDITHKVYKNADLCSFLHFVYALYLFFNIYLLHMNSQRIPIQRTKYLMSLKPSVK